MFGEPHGQLAGQTSRQDRSHVWMSERIGFTSKRAGIGEDSLSDGEATAI